MHKTAIKVWNVLLIGVQYNLILLDAYIRTDWHQQLCLSGKLQQISFCRIKEFQRGNRVSFWPLVWGCGHIGCHVWRRVIVPSDLA